MRIHAPCYWADNDRELKTGRPIVKQVFHEVCYLIFAVRQMSKNLRSRKPNVFAVTVSLCDRLIELVKGSNRIVVLKAVCGKE